MKKFARYKRPTGLLPKNWALLTETEFIYFSGGEYVSISSDPIDLLFWDTYFPIYLKKIKI